MAKFRCRLTGNVFEFVHEFDIKDMREHPQYDEVEEPPKDVPVKKVAKEKVIKKEAK